MKIPPTWSIHSKAEARAMAIEWQEWSSKKSLSYSELSSWQSFFIQLGKKYRLMREYKENGIV